MFFRRRRKIFDEISPDEIFLDSVNLPRFDKSQFEGRFEKPIGKRNVLSVSSFFLIVVAIFSSRAFFLQVVRGNSYAELSENNRLRHSVVFSERGNIYDRFGTPLAWNLPTEGSDFALRSYIQKSGFAHILGYVKYPAKDSSGFYYSTTYGGVAGIEKSYDSILTGSNGTKIIETNAHDKIVSESQIHAPISGGSITLSIDARIQEVLYGYIKELAERVGFQGGAGIIMDIDTGELVAMTSFPEYDLSMFSSLVTSKEVEKVLSSPRKPFLNRAISGLYTPGSIVKPLLAVGALNEGVINPLKEFVSTGKLLVPNPYNPDQPSVFTDWKAHGSVDMRRALAVSSNIYFYILGGGFGNQKGLGIEKIEKYLRLFGFGETTGLHLGGELAGVIPSPEWKKENFKDGDWRLGDTYNTSIGQYGMQVTPLQIAVAVSAIANKGIVFEPSIFKNENATAEIKRVLDIDSSSFDVVQEGMRQAVLEGTASGLNTSSVSVAAKTGTAELGVSKSRVNSWATGFFPYENPKYAFVVLMESGPRENLYGGVYVMRQLLDWMAIYASEYFDN